MTKFILRPDYLKINNAPLIDYQILDLLNRKQIELYLDIWDSAEDNFNIPIIVFIHGNTTSKRVFDEHIDLLSSNYRIINIDLLGHGQSSMINNIAILTDEEKDLLSNTFYNPLIMVAQIIQLLEAKNIINAHIIGWSLGGHFAYGLANISPYLAASITTIASPPVRISIEGFRKGFFNFFPDQLIPEWINMPRNFTEKDLNGIASYNGYILTEEKDKFFFDDVMASDPLMRKFFYRTLYDDSFDLLDGEQFVLNTSLPICFIIGDQDFAVKKDYILSFEHNLKNNASRVIVIHGAKHAVFKTHFNKFHDIVSHFLKSLENTIINKLTV